MSSNISPSIVFSGQARGAFEFYRSVFGGELSLNEFGPMGAEGGFAADAIMHAQLVTDAGWSLMGDDSTPLEKQFWGDTFGGLVDKFGIRWGFNISGS